MQASKQPAASSVCRCDVGDADCASLLIKAGAPVNLTVGMQLLERPVAAHNLCHLTFPTQAKACKGWTPLHELMASGAAGDLRLTGFQTPLEDSLVVNVLIYFCSGGNSACCVAMLDGGADRAIRDAEGHTSVYLMAEYVDAPHVAACCCPPLLLIATCHVSRLCMYCDHLTIKAMSTWKSEAERQKERQRAW
jgi:hypothetical protein